MYHRKTHERKTEEVKVDCSGCQQQKYLLYICSFIWLRIKVMVNLIRISFLYELEMIRYYPWNCTCYVMENWLIRILNNNISFYI